MYPAGMVRSDIAPFSFDVPLWYVLPQPFLGAPAVNFFGDQLIAHYGGNAAVIPSPVVTSSAAA